MAKPLPRFDDAGVIAAAVAIAREHDLNAHRLIEHMAAAGFALAACGGGMPPPFVDVQLRMYGSSMTSAAFVLAVREELER